MSKETKREKNANLIINGKERPKPGPYPPGVLNGPDPATPSGHRRRKKKLGL